MAGSSTRKPKKPTLNQLSSTALSLEELELWKVELLSGSGRSCALIAAAHMDHVLSQAVLGRFRTDITDEETATLITGMSAPISSFGAKINMAHALGHYDRATKDDLHRIRRIRNVFAHSPRSVDFDNDLISAECMALNFDWRSLKDQSARGRFVGRCSDLLVEIAMETKRVAESKLAALRGNASRLGAFRHELSNPNHPLNPHYKSDEGS